MTFKDMCDTIVESDILKKEDGSSPTSEEIFHHSPTGELFMIFGWYEMALLVLKTKAEITSMLNQVTKD